MQNKLFIYSYKVVSQVDYSPDLSLFSLRSGTSLTISGLGRSHSKLNNNCLLTSWLSVRWSLKSQEHRPKLNYFEKTKASMEKKIILTRFSSEEMLFTLQFNVYQYQIFTLGSISHYGIILIPVPFIALETMWQACTKGMTFSRTNIICNKGNCECSLPSENFRFFVLAVAKDPCCKSLCQTPIFFTSL